ncbi:Protein RKD1, partial [Linum perenne]
NELRPITDLENEKKTNDDKPPSSAAGVITKEVLSRYFYMPITEAAKELNVGLTLLKKMCRELGIKRWPHRKLMSLTALISNVRQLLDESGGGEEGGKLEEAIRVLENERKVLEESPDLQLGSNTKRLRQACFKANYKRKRKHNMMMVSDGDEDARRPTGRRGRRRSRSEDGGASGCGSVAVLESNLGYDDEGEGDEEIRSLLLPVEYDFEF